MSPARALWWSFLALALLLAWPALNGQFLSDDLAIMHWLIRWDASGTFWWSIFAKFAAGLDVPSHYYRPLALITYGFDQRAFDWSPLPWHLTGFLIHALNAFLVGATSRALGGDPLRAVTAAGLFLCFPLAPEVSIWFSGRYDALAVTGLLIAVFAHLRANGLDRWRLISLFGFMLGLAAKEAAMTTPGLLVLASFLREPTDETLTARITRCIRECLPAILLFFAYLGLRVALFDSALQVYPDTDPSGGMDAREALRRLFVLGSIPRIVYADAALAGSIALATIVLAAGAAFIVSRREHGLAAQWLLPASWTALSLLALVPHLGAVYAHGEGARFYYATAAWLALWIAPAVAILRSPLGQRLMSILLVAAFAFAQTHTLDQWARAGSAMRALLPQLEQAAAALDADAFTLALVPDHIGPVPFARNAQGGIAMPPQQPRNLLPQLVPVLPADIATWPARIRNGDIAAIKQRAIEPRLDALFCFDARDDSLKQARTLPDWHNAEAFVIEARNFAATACDLH